MLYLNRFESAFVPQKLRSMAGGDAEFGAYIRFGVPHDFWNKYKRPNFDSVDSVLFNGDLRKSIDEDDQEDFFKSFLKNPGSKLIFVGSYPTDLSAMRIAFYIQKKFIKQGMAAHAIDVLNPRSVGGEVPSALTLYNIEEKSMTPETLSIIRGCLYSYNFIPRIVAVAGDPVKFALEIVRTKVNGIFYSLDDKIVKEL